jgi:hypothetical protein
MRVLVLVVAAVVAGCGGTSSSVAFLTPGPFATSAPNPSVTWPPAPSAATAGTGWAWSAAGSADTSLVDRMSEIWTKHDIAAAGQVYADDAQMVFRNLQPAGLAMIRAGIQGSPDTYQRAGDVLVAVPSAAAWPGLADGNRLLFFKLRVTDAIVDSWLEVNRDGRIVMDWEDKTK